MLNSYVLQLFETEEHWEDANEKMIIFRTEKTIGCCRVVYHSIFYTECRKFLHQLICYSCGVSYVCDGLCMLNFN